MKFNSFFTLWPDIFHLLSTILISQFYAQYRIFTYYQPFYLLFSQFWDLQSWSGPSPRNSPFQNPKSGIILSSLENCYMDWFKNISRPAGHILHSDMSLHQSLHTNRALVERATAPIWAKEEIALLWEQSALNHMFHGILRSLLTETFDASLDLVRCQY